jgi:hypothetical protein
MVAITEQHLHPAPDLQQPQLDHQVTVILTTRLCLCCGKRSVWRLIAPLEEIVYRIFYCAQCDLKPDPEKWTDPQEDGPF